MQRIDETVKITVTIKPNIICVAKDLRIPASSREPNLCGGTTERELHKNEYEGKGVVDARHFVRREGLTANGGVAQDVKLLQKIGYYYRDCKFYDNFPYSALRKVYGFEKIFNPGEKSSFLTIAHNYLVLPVFN